MTLQDAPTPEPGDPTTGGESPRDQASAAGASPDPAVLETRTQRRAARMRAQRSGAVRVPATVAVLWGGTALGGPGLAIGAGLVGASVVGELYARSRRAGLRPQALLGLIAIASMATVGHLKGDRVSRALVGVAGALVIATFGEMLVRTDRTRLIETVLASFVPGVAVALPVAYLAAMRRMPEGERLAGTVLLVVVGAELVARALGRLAGTGVGGTARGPSIAAFVRVLGAALGAAAAAGIALGVFEPAITTERAMLIGAVGALAVGMSQPVATLLETLAGPERLSAATSVTRITSGLWLAAPMSFYAYLLVAR